MDITFCLKQLLAHHNQANKILGYGNEYDHMVMGGYDSKTRGTDAAVIRVHGTNKDFSQQVSIVRLAIVLSHPFTGRNAGSM